MRDVQADRQWTPIGTAGTATRDAAQPAAERGEGKYRVADFRTLPRRRRAATIRAGSRCSARYVAALDQPPALPARWMGSIRSAPAFHAGVQATMAQANSSSTESLMAAAEPSRLCRGHGGDAEPSGRQGRTGDPEEASRGDGGLLDQVLQLVGREPGLGERRLVAKGPQQQIRDRRRNQTTGRATWDIQQRPRDQEAHASLLRSASDSEASSPRTIDGARDRGDHEGDAARRRATSPRPVSQAARGA